VRTIWSVAHTGHRPASEIIDGRLQPHVEVPARAELVLAAVRQRRLGEVVEVAQVAAADPSADRGAVERVHDPAFVHFLETVWGEWDAAGRTWDALPYVWPGPALSRGDEPAALDGRLGHWAFDAGTPITAGTWDAAWWSARCAIGGARALLGGETSAFALCRPPGHHAGPASYGGYCYLANAAIAAQVLRDGGASRVAVLDVDYHHGNGTQSVFWDRSDVLTVSLHADPRQEYPYFTGSVGERGAGEGEGFNRNLPMPWGTAFDVWSDVFTDACREVVAFGADALVVALGVDTHEDDPISRFRLHSPDYLRIGAKIARLRLPTLFVLEGGYATEVIGLNVVNVLEGFADPR
jgi:acetoin utilization deacetylase AcuC-like enzyme